MDTKYEMKLLAGAILRLNRQLADAETGVMILSKEQVAELENLKDNGYLRE